MLALIGQGRGFRVQQQLLGCCHCDSCVPTRKEAVKPITAADFGEAAAWQLLATYCSD
jgi:hypothetical protein